MSAIAGCLTESDVNAAIAKLDQSLERGEGRSKALKAKLLELYGQNNAWTSEGLTIFERWTGDKVRGES